MNINDKGAMAVSSVVLSILSLSMLLFFQILQGNPRAKSVSSYFLMNINNLGAMAVHRTSSHPSHPSDSTSGSPGFIRHPVSLEM